MKDDLTDKQKQLVDTIVASGCSIKEAAEKAGYSTKGSKEAGRVSASRTLRLPKVQQYMQQRVAQTLGLGAVSASKRLIELSTGARSEYVQLEASRDILDRVGLKAPDRISHNIQGDIKIGYRPIVRRWYAPTPSDWQSRRVGAKAHQLS
jgi:Phage terminase, small subunit